MPNPTATTQTKRTNNSAAYLIFLWVSILLGLPLALLCGIYVEQINESNTLKALMLFAMVPVGIAEAVIAFDIIKTLKGYLLLLIPLAVLLPPIFSAVLFIALLCAYLALMTWHFFYIRNGKTGS